MDGQVSWLLLARVSPHTCVHEHTQKQWRNFSLRDYKFCTRMFYLFKQVDKKVFENTPTYAQLPATPPPSLRERQGVGVLTRGTRKQGLRSSLRRPKLKVPWRPWASEWTHSLMMNQTTKFVKNPHKTELCLIAMTTELVMKVRNCNVMIQTLQLLVYKLSKC